MRGKQSVRKGIWYIGGKRKRAPKRKKQKGGAIPFGLLASIGAPILREIVKPLLGKILGRRLGEMAVRKHIILRKRSNPVRVNLPDGRSFTSKWERISRKQLPINIKVTRNRKIGPRRNNRAIYLNQAAPALKKIKKRRNKEVLKRLGPVYDRLQQRGAVWLQT